MGLGLAIVAGRRGSVLSAPGSEQGRGCFSSNAVVRKSQLAELRRLIEIPPVKNHRLAQRGGNGGKVRRAERFPLRHHDQRIGALQGGGLIDSEVDAGSRGAFVGQIRMDRVPGLFHRHRVKGPHAGAARQQFLDDHAARRGAHVVGVGLEGQAPEGESQAAEVFAVVPDDLLHQDAFLVVVDGFHRGQDARGLSVLSGGVLEGLHVLGEAGAAVAGAGVEKAVADAGVGADTLAHQFDIGTDHVREVGQFIHERDAGGQHGVGSVLGELGRRDIHVEDTVVVAREGGVQRAHGVTCLLAGGAGIGADDDAVRAHEVFDCCAFLEEFGVGHDGEVQRGQPALLQLGGNAFADLGAGAHGHGGFVDHDLGGGHVAADIAGGRQHIAQVGGAIFVRRGAHGNELDIAETDAGFDVAGEAQAAGGMVAFDEFLQAGFVDGHFAGVEHLDLGGVEIQAKDVVAEFRQAGACDQAYIATTDDGDFHERVSREVKSDLGYLCLCVPWRLPAHEPARARRWQVRQPSGP